ncbi:PREDICTED: heavy metal-associated isoprenylated plant protein 41-like isoform X3 [Ipomoea nil]|uniref:heavy metal-associated isoprenylated plant protein 41-like isoform X3 n=1 Tax=Ipomoea nil TaxID=35883 RepID=UPI000901B4E7|nr:PREDICTED: heavy metal-associated isoprenylated plant protein 41-like isoform X3 [Ipomoea nil]
MIYCAEIIIHSTPCKVTKKYKNAESNLKKLRRLGATILHRVDAINMKLHTDLRMRKFDRIIFNFPHAGFYGKEDDNRLIQMHRSLIQGFFRNASGMLRAGGEIHVNHKTTPPFCHWNLTELASKSSLLLIECVDFNSADYPGYNQKRGDSARCDEPFYLGKCSTFKFIFSPSAYKIPNSLNHNGLAQRHPRVSVTTPQLSTKFDAPYPFNAHTAMNGSSHCAGLSQSSGCFQIFGGYFSHARETFGKVEYDIVSSVRRELDHAYMKYMAERPGCGLSGYINLLEELLDLSSSRSAWLRENLVCLDQQLMQAPQFLLGNLMAPCHHV